MTTTQTNPTLDQAQAMYDSEIDFLLVGFWDGGIDWFLGNAPSAEGQIDDAKAHHTDESPRFGNSRTIEGALHDMAEAAKLSWPDSDYALGKTGHREHEDYIAFGDIPGVPEASDDSPKLSDQQFRALLDVWMANDPIRHTAGDDEVFQSLLLVEATARGFDDLVTAYHEFKVD